MAEEPSCVVTLSPDRPDQVDAAARLHEELLPTAMPSRFGHRFMTRFFFTKLVESGLLVCDLYRHGDRYVGFSTYTRYPSSFLRRGARDHFFSLAGVLLAELLAHPGKLRLIRALARRGRRLESEAGADVGYWLGFGVRRSHLRLAVDPRGRRISTVLLEHMLDHFRREGIRWVESTVEPDNKPALLFYRVSGFRVETGPQEEVLSLRYDLAER